MKMMSFIVIIFLFLVGCQNEPGVKLKPKPKETVVVDKKINDINFNPAVDILFVIDDSGSMGSFQDQLAKNSKQFVEKFLKTKFIDYHIGVTTSTDSGFSGTYGGRLVDLDGYRYVDRKTIGAESVLNEMLEVGTRGAGTEKFFSIFRSTFSPALMSGFNSGFYRPNAELSIFNLTDADDQSFMSSTEAFDFLLDLKLGNRNKLQYVGIVTEQSAGCSGGGEPKPNKIAELVKLHGRSGFLFDICQEDYGTELARIAENIVRSVSTIHLEELPDVTTIVVTYGDFVIPNDPDTGWTYNVEDNAIFLSPNIKIDSLETKNLNIKFKSIY